MSDNTQNTPIKISATRRPKKQRAMKKTIPPTPLKPLFNRRILKKTAAKQNPVSSCDFLKKLNLCLPLATLIAVFVGSTIIYNYLNKIGHIALFSEVISTPHLLTSTVILFLILIIFLFLFPLFYPYFLAKELKELKLNKKVFLFNIIIPFSIWICVTILAILFLNNKEITVFEKTLTNKMLINAVFLITFILILILTSILYLKSKIESNNYLDIFIINTPLNLSQIMLITFGLLFSAHWFQEPSLLAAIIIVVIYALNIYIIYISFPNLADKKWNNISLYSPFVLLVILAFVMPSLPDSNIPNNILHKLGYIQKSSESKCYVVDSRFIDGYRLQSDKAGDINIFDNWKKNFHFEEVCYKYGNPNALYGYMLWNVGNTKIFCPENITPSDKEKIKKQCLKIKGDYLQLLPD